MREKVSVSVIIPCYNSSMTIERAVASIMAQSKLPKEIILVDDCSLDNGETIKLLYNLRKKFKDIIDINVIEMDYNKGAASARNVGWEKAEEKYVAFLDSDDIWHPKKIEIQYDFMKKNRQVALSCHLYNIIDKISIFNAEGKNNNSKFLNKYKVLFSNPIATRTVMIKNDSKYRFKEGKRYSEDYLLWVKVLFSENIALIESSLAGTFKSDYGVGGLSADLWNMEKGELNTYLTLYYEKIIGINLLIIIGLWSIIKFFIRILKTRFFNLKKL